MEPRRSTILLVEHAFFHPIMLCTILASCVIMAWQSPLDSPTSLKASLIDVLDAIFLVIFTAEMLVKMVAYGLIHSSGAYLRDRWCQLDFALVFLAWLPVFVPSTANYSVLRALRALRPLRALKRLPGMPVLVEWMIHVMPSMGQVFLLLTFVFLVFGIAGLELFQGALHYRCALQDSQLQLELNGLQNSDGYVDTDVPCNIELEQAGMPQCDGGATCQYFADGHLGRVAFDSIGYTFITLSKATTFDHWVAPMYELMAAFSPFAWTYFFLVVLVGGFFVVNLFLAVVFLELGEAEEHVKRAADLERRVAQERAESASGHQGGTLLTTSLVLSDEAADGAKGAVSGRDGVFSREVDLAPAAAEQRVRRRIETVFAVVNDRLGLGCLRCTACVAAPPPDSPSRLCIKAVATSTHLSHGATVLVIFNILLMCMPYQGMPAEYANAIEEAMLVITWLFVLEMACKLYGLGCVSYWADGWNALDGCIVSLSLFEMALTTISKGTGVHISFLRILRILRVVRVLRLMRAWRGLYQVVSTFLRALPQLANIVVLIALCMFIFALLGMQLFGGIWSESNGYSLTSCPPVNQSPSSHRCANGLYEKPRFHFDYAGPAMITVFIILTGEWVDEMAPITSAVGPSASIFFIGVVMLGKFLLLNLLIAVILHEFSGEKDTDLQRADRTSSAANSARLSTRSGSPASISDHGGDEVSSGRSSRIGVRWNPQKSGAIPVWPDDHTLFLFGPQSETRRMCSELIQQPWFDQAVLFVIASSSLCLAFDTPRLDQSTSLAWWLGSFNLIFTLFFLAEMCVKIVALGLFAMGEGSYLRSRWNQVRRATWPFRAPLYALSLCMLSRELTCCTSLSFVVARERA